MRRLAILTLLIVAMSVKSLACEVASELVFGANATPYYRFDSDKVCHFDMNHRGVDEYVEIKTSKQYAAYIFNGGTDINISSYIVSVNILIVPFVREGNAVILPKDIAAGGYLNISSLSKGYVEVERELGFR